MNLFDPSHINTNLPENQYLLYNTAARPIADRISREYLQRLIDEKDDLRTRLRIATAIALLATSLFIAAAFVSVQYIRQNIALQQTIWRLEVKGVPCG